MDCARDPRAPEQPALGYGALVALVAFLFFLGFPLTDMLEHRPPATAHLVAVLVALAVFVAVYLRVMIEARSRRDTLLSIGTIAVLAVAVSLDDTSEWAPMLVYVSAACGFRLPPREGRAGIAACAAAVGAVAAVNGYDPRDGVEFALYCVAVGAMLRGYAHMLSVNTELHAARDQIARLAIGEERLRFARDLHDLLGHSLSVIALKSELARRLVRSEPDAAEREVADIERVTRDALVEVREAVSGYRRMTLADELRGAETALAAAGIRAEVTRPAVAFPPEVESVLAWAVREGTTNVIRHSGARHCAIRIHAGLSDAGVEIVDDGTSPPAERDGRDGEDGSGSGLAGLRERVARRHGRLEAAPRPEGGFRLAIDIPALP